MIKFQHIDADGSVSEIRGPLLANFGITEFLAAAVTSALTSAGVGAVTAGIGGTIGAGALEGGAIGAITNPRAPLKGAEAGAITGGVTSGFAPVVGDVLGTGATASSAIAGGIGGALGSAATGQNIGTGAVTGGVGGALSSAIGGATPSTTTPPTGGPAGSAAATAAPASVPAGAPTPAEGLADVANVGGPELAGGTGATPSPITAATTPGTGQIPSSVGDTPTAPSIGSSDLLTAPSGISGSVAASQPATASSTPAAATTPASPAAAAGPPAKTGIGGWLSDNSWAIPAAGLGLAALQSQKKLPGQAAIDTNAAALNAQGKQLQNYFASGTLPPGIQAGIDRASEAAKASIRSRYASEFGGGASSAEAQDLSNVDVVSATQGSQIALNLLQQGVSEQGMADQLYQQIMTNALTQDQQLGTAIGAFSAAMVPQTAYKLVAATG